MKSRTVREWRALRAHAEAYLRETKFCFLDDEGCERYLSLDADDPRFGDLYDQLVLALAADESEQPHHVAAVVGQVRAVLEARDAERAERARREGSVKGGKKGKWNRRAIRSAAADLDAKGFTAPERNRKLKARFRDDENKVIPASTLRDILRADDN